MGCENGLRPFSQPISNSPSSYKNMIYLTHHAVQSTSAHFIKKAKHLWTTHNFFSVSPCLDASASCRGRWLILKGVRYD